jgi:hypothetical protein
VVTVIFCFGFEGVFKCVNIIFMAALMNAIVDKNMDDAYLYGTLISIIETIYVVFGHHS